MNRRDAVPTEAPDEAAVDAATTRQNGPERAGPAKVASPSPRSRWVACGACSVAECPPWYLPVGQKLDGARCAVLIATFRPEVVRVGRALRAKVLAEQPGARLVAKLCSVRDIVGTTTGYTRDPVLRGIGVAHLYWERHGGPQVVPICVDWETGEVYAVIGLKPWVPEDDA
jgi:hypothetical protein